MDWCLKTTVDSYHLEYKLLCFFGIIFSNEFDDMAQRWYERVNKKPNTVIEQGMTPVLIQEDVDKVQCSRNPNND